MEADQNTTTASSWAMPIGVSELELGKWLEFDTESEIRWGLNKTGIRVRNASKRVVHDVFLDSRIGVMKIEAMPPNSEATVLCEDPQFMESENFYIRVSWLKEKS